MATENVSFSHLAPERWTVPATQVHSLIAGNGTWTYAVHPGKMTHEIRLNAAAAWAGTTITVTALQRAGDTYTLVAGQAANWTTEAEGFPVSISFVVTNYAAVPITVAVEAWNPGDRAAA